MMVIMTLMMLVVTMTMILMETTINCNLFQQHMREHHMQRQGRHIWRHFLNEILNIWRHCFNTVNMMLVEVIFTRSVILGDDDDGKHEDDGDEDDQLTHHQVGHILSLAPHTLAPALGIAKSEFITISMIQIS